MCNDNPCKCERKVINWSKPLRWTGNSDYKVEVLGEDGYSDKWHVRITHPRASSAQLLIIDKYGNCLGNSYGSRIENIPEEPFDTLILYARKGLNDWSINTGTHENCQGQLYRRSYADKYIRDRQSDIFNFVAVKVK